MQYCVLASGSSGNASFVAAHGFGVLLDLGLAPRTLAARLGQVGSSWEDVQAALLTHTHGDHWNENTLRAMERRRLPLYCHARHAQALRRQSPAFADMDDAGLVHNYSVGAVHYLGPGLRFLPLRLKHDDSMTCGFRIEGPRDLFGHAWSLGHASDLGSWEPELAEALANVDLLALEFNHDEELERASGRFPRLIRRVLGEHGHLSNDQAARLLAEVLRRSTPGRIRHLVQLHLSSQCNRPELAQAAAERALAGLESRPRLHTAGPGQAGPLLGLGEIPRRRRRRRVRPRVLVGADAQPWLPGWEADCLTAV